MGVAGSSPFKFRVVSTYCRHPLMDLAIAMTPHVSADVITAFFKVGMPHLQVCDVSIYIFGMGMLAVVFESAGVSTLLDFFNDFSI